MKQQSVGACIYCGQTQMMEFEGAGATENPDKLATEKCNCDSAKKARKSALIQAKAVDSIESLFEADFPNTAGLLKAAVISIGMGQIDQVVIDTGMKVKAKIARTAKGNIKVERLETRKTVLES